MGRLSEDKGENVHRTLKIPAVHFRDTDRTGFVERSRLAVQVDYQRILRRFAQYRQPLTPVPFARLYDEPLNILKKLEIEADEPCLEIG